MTDDLVKRLRTINIEWDRRLTEWRAEAADRIEELEKQVRKDALQYLSDTGKLLDDVVEAEKASDEWAEIAMGMGKKFNEANARVKELEAEIKKLKQEVDA